MKISREEYMKDSKTLHAAYYGQFVTPQIKQLVGERIGLQTLQNSRDEHLNDIPLHRWDHLAGAHPLTDYRTNRRLFPGAPDNSLATAVCILKEAARQLVQEQDLPKVINSNGEVA